MSLARLPDTFTREPRPAGLHLLAVIKL